MQMGVIRQSNHCRDRNRYPLAQAIQSEAAGTTSGKHVSMRAIVMQKKPQRHVQFEITAYPTCREENGYNRLASEMKTS